MFRRLTPWIAGISAVILLAAASAVSPVYQNLTLLGNLSLAGQASGPGLRTRLTGPLTFYVNDSIGVDSGSCGYGTGTAACNTIQQAITNVYNIFDTVSNTVTIQAATTGVNYGPFSVSGMMTGGATLVIQGDTGNLRNVVVDGGGAGVCVNAQFGAVVKLNYLKIQNCNDILSSTYTYTTLQESNFAFGACSGSSGEHQYSSHTGTIQNLGNTYIDSATNCAYHIVVNNDGSWSTTYSLTGATATTLEANVGFSAFVLMAAQGKIFLEGYSATPFALNGFTASGFGWSCASGGLMQTLVSDHHFFPGNGQAILTGDCFINQLSHTGATISGFAGGTAISGDDYNGLVTAGGSDTGGTITFGFPFDTVPICSLTCYGSSGSSCLPLIVSVQPTLTGFSIGHPSATQSFSYHCHG